MPEITDKYDMSDEHKKPIIFMYPINETLAKLKEYFEEQEHVEVFEVDMLQEASQLFGTMAPAVVVSSDPKKMLQFLAQNKKVNQKTNSKSVLISNRDFNYRATRKFDQLGLNEIIKEPIAPKTLYYKVNLLIKSLKKKTNPEDESYNMKEGSNEHEEISTDDKLRLEKGIVTEKSDSFMRGKVMTQEEKEDLEKEKELLALAQQSERELRKKKREEQETTLDLGGNMEGKGDGQLKDLGGNFEASNSLKDDPSFDDIVGKNMASDLEKTGADEQKKKNGLKLEEVDKQARKNNYKEKEMGGHLRGDLSSSDKTDKGFQGKSLGDVKAAEESSSFSSSLGEAEKPSDKKKTTELNLTDDDKKKEREGYVEQEKDWGKKKTTNLNLEDDQDKKERAEDGLSALKPEKKKTTNLDLESDEEKKKRELQEEEKKKKNRSANVADQLGGSNKGKSSTDEIDRSGLSGKSKFEEQERKQNNKGQFGESLQSDPMKGKLGEQQQKDTPDKDRNSELEFANEDEGKDIDLNKEIGQKNKKEKQDQAPFFQEEKERKQAENKADDIDKYMRSKTGKQLEQEQKQRQVERQLRQAEQKNGKRPEHLKENDDNWDFDKDQLEQAQEEFTAKVDRPNLERVETDLGEQTIDYAKIKKAYEEGGSDIDAFEDGRKAGKKQPYTFETADPAQSKHYYRDESGELKNFEKSQEQEAESENVFRPDSKGFENMIKILNRYQDKDHNMQETLTKISEIILQKGGMTAFYYNQRNVKENEESMQPLVIQHELSGSEEVKASWQQLISEHFSSWKEKQVPGWEDHTFQIEKNFYHFPFYEGLQCLGFAVVTFEDSGNQDETGFIETMLESARGIYLEKYHHDGGEINYGDAAPKNILSFAKKDKPKEKKKGFLSGLFSKKAS